MAHKKKTEDVNYISNAPKMTTIRLWFLPSVSLWLAANGLWENISVGQVKIEHGVTVFDILPSVPEFAKRYLAWVFFLFNCFFISFCRISINNRHGVRYNVVQVHMNIARWIFFYWKTLIVKNKVWFLKFI